jgi:endonuclease YncB( thermonuclease family)
MRTDQKWKWAGIVSLVSIAGVLLTDIVANVVAGYISEQIKAWQVPESTAAQQPPAPLPETMMAASGRSFPERQASVAPQALSPAEPQPKIAALPQALPPPEAQPKVAVLPPSETQPEAVAAPKALPPSEPQPEEVTGRVEQVIDTGTLKIEGETIHLAGITGLASPYRDQLQKFIEEQGREIRCTPSGTRHTCFVKNVDLALAALTNGAALLAEDATPQYQHAAEDARRNRRGIFQ